MKDYLDLVRAPAAFTVLGDTLAGSAAAGHPFSVRRLPLSAASALLYAGGMALNDYADRELDAVERPERPIPAGRISARNALYTAAGLSAAGIGLAAVAGGKRSLFIALPLAASIWTYDLVAKPTVLGPLMMSACRGLDVLMGAGAGSLRKALPTALVIAGHTASVTALSRGEVNGSTPAAAAAASSVTAVSALAAVAGSGSGKSAGLAALAGVRFLGACLPAQLQATRNPAADQVRTATRSGIKGMIPLQAALAARSAALPTAVGLLALDGLTKLAFRRRSRSDIT